MKLAVFIIATGCLIAVAYTQSASRRPDPPPGDAQDDSQSLSPDQKAQVKAILSKYDAAKLTATDARAINDAFRSAGLRNGPGLQEAIREAAFVPERIGELDPPPDRPGDDRSPDEAQRTDDRERPRDRRGPPDRKRPGDRGDSRDGDNPPDQRRPRRGGGGYSIEQAISDRAQLNTIAFDGLAFLTGDFGANTFLPPGKVADYCGFQYMRDVDTNELGHNTSFVPRAANNVLYILTDAQKAQLVALAKEQEKLLTDFAYKRFPLIKALSRELAGDVPAGKTLNREAVMKYTAELYEIDGLLSYRRAEVLGGIVRSLTAEQKAYLGKMVFNNSATWPELKDQMDKRSMSHTAHVAVMTYASEMFSWYAGSVEGDVYFCPERHATYFGSFYMKDIPAMGNPNFSISTSLTGDSGEAFLAALSEPQRKLITGLIDQQRADLNEIVKTRRAVATELRQFMKAASVDNEKVMSLSRRYGELDGEISYFYTRAFTEVARTLTAEQKQKLMKLRNLDAKFTVKGAYLYSRAIEMPAITNTDFFFAGSGSSMSVKPPSAAVPTVAPAAKSSFVLRSPAATDGGELPKEFTGDGARATLPLEWTGAPVGTRSFAVIMHHVAPDQTKWYWVLYDIPANAQSLPKNAKGIGTLGNNSVNGRAEYAPPQSKGPGAKTYIYTVYALSDSPKIDVPPTMVTRDVLLTAMSGRVLASAELQVVYARDVQGDRDRNDDNR